MASTISLENAKKIISFPFQGEKRGIKIIIGAALFFANYLIPLIPILPVLGYAVRVMKRVILEEEDPVLPEWTDWGSLFLDGLKVFGAMLIYQLPALALAVIGYGIMFLPIFFITAAASSSSFYESAFPIFIMVGNFAGMALFMLGMFLAMAAMVFMPAVLGNMIAKGNFVAAFQVKEWWPVFKANLAGSLLAIALLLGLYFGLGYAAEILVFTVVLCFLMPFAVGLIGFLMSVIMMALFAVTYRDGVKALSAK
jgi:hypothetical protein